MYSEIVMDHFRNPRNAGRIEDADGIGQVGNPKCGDIMKIYLKIKDDIIEDVKFETFGCGSAIASSSIATEMIKGKSINEAVEISNKAIELGFADDILEDEKKRVQQDDFTYAFSRRTVTNSLLNKMCPKDTKKSTTADSLEKRLNNIIH
jgi:SUF system NifU family Fe-S assembly protein